MCLVGVLTRTDEEEVMFVTFPNHLQELSSSPIPFQLQAKIYLNELALLFTTLKSTKTKLISMFHHRMPYVLEDHLHHGTNIHYRSNSTHKVAHPSHLNHVFSSLPDPLLYISE